ncbi:hypothetical protein J5N97_026490 [Dioscorea zingiberensis]|uniref:Uncharacterized protein n=1 Tax=Dioscorea zingiberensis TaxID=325984 RepID=A0A9D5C3M8_9LILI|nr:hypothetical protein J5N97_026490 [Dioscorea zingiberensis]
MKGGKSKAETKKADSKLSIKKKETKPKPKPTKNEKAGKDPNKPKPPSALSSCTPRMLVFSAFGFVYKSLPLKKLLGFRSKCRLKFIVGDLDLTYHYPGIQDCSSISNSRASSLTSGRQSMRGNEHVASSYTFQGQMSSSSLLPQQGRQQMFSSGSREYDNAQHQSSYSNPAPDAQYGSMKRE